MNHRRVFLLVLFSRHSTKQTGFYVTPRPATATFLSPLKFHSSTPIIPNSTFARRDNFHGIYSFSFTNKSAVHSPFFHHLIVPENAITSHPNTVPCFGVN